MFFDTLSLRVQWDGVVAGILCWKIETRSSNMIYCEHDL